MTDEVKHLASYLRIAYAESAPAKMRFLEAADLIESLSAELEQVERERDAAVEDLRSETYSCETCANYTPGYFCLGCRNKSNWQWRGPGGTQL